MTEGRGSTAWHDRQVAAAADAWLNEPRDTEAYRRLVVAIETRRAWMNPRLDEITDDNADRPHEETTDWIADQHPPAAVRDVLGDRPATVEDAKALLRSLRRD